MPPYKKFERFLSQPDGNGKRIKLSRSNSLQHVTPCGKIAIVGVGSRGLTILERLTAIYDEQLHYYELDIYLIDPGRYHGQGVHSSEQSDNLLINTVACQVTMFGDESVLNCGPMRKGPSLFEWAKNINNEQCKGREIKENDYLSRALLGKYLKWCHDELVNNLPKGIRVHHYYETVNDLQRLNDGRLKLFLANDCTLYVDCAILTTGHGQNFLDNEENIYTKFVEECCSINPHLNYFRSYPLNQLQSIDKHAKIAIQGLGLSCHDVLSELT
ncbi:unnamed protein product, partial [Didymodactylos carnosus]